MKEFGRGFYMPSYGVFYHGIEEVTGIVWLLL